MNNESSYNVEAVAASLPKVGVIEMHDSCGHASVQVFTGMRYDAASYARCWREQWTRVGAPKGNEIAGWRTWIKATMRDTFSCG